MMKLTKTLSLVLLLISGFVASATKPDFAFPKQVSKTAGKELDAALKKHDGPATLQALITLSLADAAMEPDSMAAIGRRMGAVAARVGDPVTAAMVRLLRASATDSVRWADSALVVSDALRAASVDPWRRVIDVDPLYTPTLYDFAVARRLALSEKSSDSLLSQVREFHRADPAPYIYWTLYNCYDPSVGFNLYADYKADWISFYPLLWLDRNTSPSQAPQLYAMTQEWLDSHASTAPHSAVDEVRQLVARLTAPGITAECRAVTRPSDPLPVKVSARCTESASLAVYSMKPNPTLVRTVPLRFSGSGVFTADTLVCLSLPVYGEYRIVPLLPDDTPGFKRDGCDVAVTDFILEVERFGSIVDPLALSLTDGSVMPEVQISRSQNYLTGKLGADIYSPRVWASSYSRSPEQWRTAANILADRSIYHPGDTIRFMATAYRYRAGEHAVNAGARVVVRLYDANGREAASAEGVSDNLGRVSGVLPIPDNGLTGHFSMRVDDMSGYASVMVSDYKAPQFEVSLSAERVDSTTIHLSGTTVNYNGFPVQSGRVRMVVSKLRPRVWFWNYRGAADETLASVDSVTTDADGRFSADIRVPAGVGLSASVTVTSPLGESHDADCFVPGKPYFISAEIPANLRLPAKGPWSPVIKAVNASGDDVALPLSVSLESAADTLRDVTDWTVVPSGLYKVVIATADPDMADTLAISDVALYRTSDAEPPMQSALWVPETKVNSGDNLLLGTSWSDSHIRYVLWTPDTVIERRWLTPARGNFTIPVSLPDGVDDATLTLWTLRDYKLTTHSVAVKRADAVRSLRLQISSLRPDVMAGDRELWTITVTDNLGRPVNDAAVVLDVYAKALDALQPHSLDFNPMSGSRWAYGVVSGNIYDQYSRSARYPRMPQLPPSEPIAFNTFGRSWPRFHTYYLNGAMSARGAVMYKAMAVSTADCAEADEAVVEDCAEAVSYLSDAGAAAVVTGGASEADARESYRLPELPLALWSPVITTGADGSARVQFTVPDANTTWAVKALAYDSGLLTGAFGSDFIASKPVMVQGSFPRFLRQGDSLPLLASMINSTDSVQPVGGFIEVFDPMADTLIHRVEAPAEPLGAHASRVISLPLSVGSLNLIGVRVRAEAGDFTDGEQAVIPVLPARVTVTESTPILMDADSASLSLDVRPGSVVEFTANAAWECVLALPGLRDSQGKSAFSAVAELYSAAVADGLLRSYPAIGRAIASWERSDSAFVSRLQKNEDLKIALLENTPWVQAAESDSERMARLSLLLDRRNTSRAISSAIHTLGKLARQGGGFAWTADGTESDFWVTMQVLRQLSSLRRMEYLPDNAALAKLIADAVKYLDKTAATDFVKYPDSDYSEYVYIRSAFSDVALPSTARRVVNATVQRLVGDWRDLGFAAQARAALILNSNGYPSTARLILESLRQHGAWRQTGVTAGVLRAFAVVEPGCADVEQIRMFLLSRKQTMDWGRGLQTSDVISAILTSGADWLVPAANSISVSVDGRHVDVAPEAVCGSFRLDLPNGGLVAIAKGRFPAWGGVWTRTEATGDSVNAVGGRELHITRTVSGDLSVGSKVTVTLTVEADRPMDYVVVSSPRAACMQPVDQLPRSLWGAYVEPVATATSFFIRRLPKGRTVLTEECYVTSAGDFMLAPAQVQSQYAPEFTASSAGLGISVKKP